MPLAYFNINARENPIAIDFLYYLSMIRFVGNKSKKHENTVSIKSLLMVSLIPTHEEVRRTGNRSIKERIYKRFLGAMHAVSTVVKPSYCLDGCVVTEKDLTNLSYHEFLKVNVHFEWI